jgi:phytoene/squalene synthetase
VRRYRTFDQLLSYCRCSANPVGRIVLYMCGYRDTERQQLSDCICTALQLANFWQDVRRDLLELDRIYIPAESLRHFDVTEEQLHAGVCDDRYRELMRFEIERTEAFLDEGDKLPPLLHPSVRPQIELFGRSGRALLQALRDSHYDTLSGRPTLSSWRKGGLIIAASFAHIGGFLSLRRHR